MGQTHIVSKINLTVCVCFLHHRAVLSSVKIDNLYLLCIGTDTVNRQLSYSPFISLTAHHPSPSRTFCIFVEQFTTFKSVCKIIISVVCVDLFLTTNTMKPLQSCERNHSLICKGLHQTSGSAGAFVIKTRHLYLKSWFWRILSVLQLFISSKPLVVSIVLSVPVGRRRGCGRGGRSVRATASLA